MNGTSNCSRDLKTPDFGADFIFKQKDIDYIHENANNAEFIYFGKHLYTIKKYGHGFMSYL